MASKQVQCEMCCKEHAVGFCNTCGNIGDSCVEIHKTGRAFKTHIMKMYGKGGYNPRRIMSDITEEICKYHPAERTPLFCKTHDTMICGRCLHSDHLSCENVDLCQEAKHIDYDQVNDITQALKEIKDELKRMKDEVDRKNATSNTHSVKCNNELDDLENKMKSNVDDSIRDLRKEACKINDENTDAFSCISSVCEEKLLWVDKEERQIDDYVSNSLPGYLYVLGRNFKKKSSEVKRQIKEAEYKHTFKNICLKENKVALKCLVEDLRDVCEVQEEVDGSDEGTANSHGSARQETQMTRKKLYDELKEVKQDLENTEKTSKSFRDKLLQANQVIEKSEKTQKGFEQELLKAKQSMDESEKTSKAFEGKLLQTNLVIANSEETEKGLEQEFLKAKQNIDKSEKTRQEQWNELKKVKQDLDNSEKSMKWFEQELLNATQVIEDTERTRKGLYDELKQVKQDQEKTSKAFEKKILQENQVKEKSEKTRQVLLDELKKVKQDLDNSEKSRKWFEQELLSTKQGIEISEMTRKKLYDELKQDLENSEKTRKAVENKLLHANQVIEKSEKTRHELSDELTEVKHDLDDSKKNPKAPSDTFGKPMVVAAFDFGMTFSGYAYSLIDDPTRIATSQTWHSHSGQISLKTPTCVLLNPQEEFDAFGFEAEDKYFELVKDGKHKHWMLFRRFKMLLHNNDGLNQNATVEDITGKKMPAMTIFAMSIGYLRDQLVNVLNRNIPGFKESDIFYVITVPAICSDDAKQFMREAALKAGLDNNRIKLVLEAEAASIWCQQINTSLKTDLIKTGSQIMVVDIGGETSNIYVHEENIEGTFKEMHTVVSSGPWGGTCVDQKFISWMTNLFGETTMSKYKKEEVLDYCEFLRSFEEKKRTMNLDINKSVVFRLPIILTQMFNQAQQQTIKQKLVQLGFEENVTFTSDKLRVSADIARSWFSESIAKTTQHMIKLLSDVKMMNVSTILLVGSYSECKLVQDSVHKKIRNKKIIIPEEAWLAVLKGAVIFGHFHGLS